MINNMVKVQKVGEIMLNMKVTFLVEKKLELEN